MWTIHGAAALLTVALLLPAPAGAEEIYNLNQNQTGFTLPGVTLPQGQDEVRAADGTTCRSAVAGSGAYIDVGVIRGNGSTTGEMATYGRLVVPLGRHGKRIDCARLYELEVKRLEMELKLLRMGIGDGGTRQAREAGWAEQGWSDGAAR